MDEVLGTARLPIDFVRVLSAQFILTGCDGTHLSTDLRKVGGLHAFLFRLTAGAAPVPGLAELALLGFDQDGEAHILHLLFSFPIGPHEPNQRLFGCCGELPAERPPTITGIPVASFGAWHAIGSVS